MSASCTEVRDMALTRALPQVLKLPTMFRRTGAFLLASPADGPALGPVRLAPACADIQPGSIYHHNPDEFKAYSSVFLTSLSAWSILRVPIAWRSSLEHCDEGAWK
jgi:hypothetical protein